MRLDCYFIRRDAEDVKFPEDINLCGGMFSGNGSDGSFCGKVYDEVFETLTGHSLYSDMDENTVSYLAGIFSQEIEEMYGDLPDDHVVDGQYENTVRELQDLARLFKSAAENNCIMIASY